MAPQRCAAASVAPQRCAAASVECHLPAGAGIFKRRLTHFC
jgi:hypothetical protein